MGQRSSTNYKMLLLVSLRNKYALIDKYPWCFYSLLVYLGGVAYISVEISLGSCWRRGIF